jgi:hypothetical protein
MSNRITAVLLFVLLFLATWKPAVRFGEHGELGRIDALSIHGLSHGHIDGAGDIPHVALNGVVLLGALGGALGRRRATDVSATGAVVLGLFVAARILSRSEIAHVADWGLPALLLLGLVGARHVATRRACLYSPHACHPNP